MYKKIFISYLILTISLFASLAFAEEMERWASPINMDNNFKTHTFKTQEFNFQSMKPFKTTSTRIGAHTGNDISKSYMKPYQTNTVNLDDKLSKYTHEKVQKLKMKSVADPYDKYAVEKFKHDALTYVNTAIQISTAATSEGIVPIVGAVNNILHNYGPEKIHKPTGVIGDVVFISGRPNALKTANKLLGKSLDAQRERFMEPFTTSDVKSYKFKTNDGFTERVGSGVISVTKTYTPPKSIKPVGIHGFLDGTTHITTKTHTVTRVRTGNFNNNYSTSTLPITKGGCTRIPGKIKIPSPTVPDPIGRYGIPDFSYGNFGRR